MERQRHNEAVRIIERGVFVYMPTRGINLYPVKPAAASIQRLLVSLSRIPG